MARQYIFKPFIGVAAGGGKSLTLTLSGFDDEAQAIQDGAHRAIFNLTLRAGFKINNVRVFFERHFNSDSSRGAYFGLTYVL